MMSEGRGAAGHLSNDNFVYPIETMLVRIDEIVATVKTDKNFINPLKTPRGPRQAMITIQVRQKKRFTYSNFCLTKTERNLV